MTIHCPHSHSCDGLNMNCYEENCTKVRVKVDTTVTPLNVHPTSRKRKAKNVTTICSLLRGRFFSDVTQLRAL